MCGYLYICLVCIISISASVSTVLLSVSTESHLINEPAHRAKRRMLFLSPARRRKIPLGIASRRQDEKGANLLQLYRLLSFVGGQEGKRLYCAWQYGPLAWLQDSKRASAAWTYGRFTIFTRGNVHWLASRLQMVSCWKPLQFLPIGIVAHFT